ncbi:hypothetical protein GUITHDRAFT_108173 [Guillardia theta CCMP2712]|uniref:PH domain-containing protein n=1 Tax=Guillardia theta (strain CCMP2712) TaxID=905079 RepID=L1JDE4_GUITC|nr:hypothetical protein GUITHDRAFT_108173 [Guillardia theta CCMP2712]EKX46139.1 hypothetical protein GUITHDRAFT_108173 [Guillardia theta CCMP2712]|eukprot:XP_005833119.1 hypothetical protein GUITHDRAFT_108173 [Guillardia theta CCMP2712]
MSSVVISGWLWRKKTRLKIASWTSVQCVLREDGSMQLTQRRYLSSVTKKIDVHSFRLLQSPRDLEETEQTFGDEIFVVANERKRYVFRTMNSAYRDNWISAIQCVLQGRQVSFDPVYSALSPRMLSKLREWAMNVSKGRREYESASSQEQPHISNLIHPSKVSLALMYALNCVGDTMGEKKGSSMERSVEHPIVVYETRNEEGSREASHLSSVKSFLSRGTMLYRKKGTSRNKARHLD